MKKIYFLLIVLCFFMMAKAQIVNIPDANFKAKLLAASPTNTIAQGSTYNVFITIDANNDGEIDVNEAKSIYKLDVSNSNISDLTGISYFTGIENLNCSQNKLTNLTIDDSIFLRYLIANHNLLSSINVHLGTLEVFDLSYNKFTSFAADGAYFADIFDLTNNQLTNLTFNNCQFYHLNVGGNNLTSIQFNGNCGITKTAIFSNNQLSLLDFTNVNFYSDCHLYLGDNVVDSVLFGASQPQPGSITYSSKNTFFDLGNFRITTDCHPEDTGHLNIWDSPNLKHIILKNGFNHSDITCIKGDNVFNIPALDLSIYNCPNLAFICVDESESADIQKIISKLNLQNQVQVNSYCSFTPEGTYYTIQGNSKSDNNNNGCDALDINNPNLKFNITDGTNTGSLISNALGNYSISVLEGTHTITPKLENPTYFTVSPTTVSVTFPTQTSPFVQDFCITPNGVHPDLEITLLPLEAARPGFDTKYKIVYKNKGNQVQSGSVNLTFDDAVLDLVVSNPVTTTQTTNNLSWNFTNLLPFETREITFTLNVNSPMEIPAVNGGYVLAYKTTIVSTATDETPLDNSFAFNQTVVNSFDPNDKTCLEGTVISPSLIGQYVHYMIRFENTGTFPAENIVVKDIIDLSKFDISTLIPTSSSHSYVTNISSGNKVEFIFENINLPYDDANNDGYIAFKIKTKPALKVGDTFTNDASIFFDYNFPIVTNKASSIFKTVLATQDFEFSNYFTLYPNPAKSVLNISSKETIEVQSINIYNTLGQLVLVVPNAEKVSKIDVSNLTSGNYFIKINSDKGTSNTRFIKE